MNLSLNLNLFFPKIKDHLKWEIWIFGFFDFWNLIFQTPDPRPQTPDPRPQT
nr:hypothetical protein [Allomuricauda sp.]